MLFWSLGFVAPTDVYEPENIDLSDYKNTKQQYNFIDSFFYYFCSGIFNYYY